MGNDSFPLSLQDLPTIVESYKTYDDINLVKSANIGQVSRECFSTSMYTLPFSKKSV